MNLPEQLLSSGPPCRNEEQRNVTIKGKSYRSGGVLNLGNLHSRSGGLSSGDSLGRLGLLDDSRGGNSFGGRHYKNRSKGELGVEK